MANLNDRPVRDYEPSTATRWVRRLALGITVGVAISLLALYPSLPSTIATHYNFAGQADAWGPRASVFELVAIFIVVVGGCTWLSFYPRVFNYPVPVTEHNAQRLYRIGEQMMVWVCAACALIFAGITLTTLFELNSSLVLAPGFVIMMAAIVGGMARMLRV